MKMKAGLSSPPVKSFQSHSIGSDQIEWANRWGVESIDPDNDAVAPATVHPQGTSPLPRTPVH